MSDGGSSQGRGAVIYHSLNRRRYAVPTGGGRVRHWLQLGWLAIILSALCVLQATPAAAASQAPVAPVCHASVSPDTPVAAVLANSGSWRCDDSNYDHRNGRNLLRFSLDGAFFPTALVTRLGTFDSITVIPLGPNGPGKGTRYTMRDARPADAGLQQTLPLPAFPANTQEVVVVVDGVWTSGVLSEARLVDDMGAIAWSDAVMMVVVAICGLLLGPLIFNLALWRVLRERFLIWHFVMVLGMLMQTMTSTGLIVRIFPTLTVSQMLWLLQISISGTMAVAFVFSTHFIEQGKLSPRMIRGLRWSAAWLLVVAGFYQLRIPPTREIAADFYYASYLPALIVLCLAMTQAVRRGSRAALFQILAWAPLLVLSLVRIITNLGVGAKPDDTLVSFTVAVALEVVITALGVADRFVIIRLDRDRAEQRAGEMERMAHRDPLTGLSNRREIEARIDELFDQGFCALAVVDLDYFKEVNDDHGHQVGDAVLVACATALGGGNQRDCIAMRIGGEEFLLLMRGDDIGRRVEQRRQAITLQTARQVTGLTRPVTASVGLLELPDALCGAMSFDEMYRRADKLLYEAKNAGRNRMVAERLTVFTPETGAAVA